METPNVSHFASARGNTGKSTARMEMIVIRSMCARYVVSAGRGGMSTDGGGIAGYGGDGVYSGLVGVDGREDDRLEGRGVPDSRRGTSSKRPVGKSRSSDSKPGAFANSVTESSKGTTSISHSVGKCIDLGLDRRVRRAECRAIEHCIRSVCWTRLWKSRYGPARRRKSC